MKFSEAFEALEGEWIAFRISCEGADPEGEVVLHRQKCAEFDRLLVGGHIRNVYVTFAGEIFPESFVSMFVAPLFA